MRFSEERAGLFRRRSVTKPAASDPIHSGRDRVVDAVLHLQRAVGNQAVARWMNAGDSPVPEDFPRPERGPLAAGFGGRIPPALRINAPEDPREQAADRAAAKITGGSGRGEGEMDLSAGGNASAGRLLPAHARAAISSMTGGAPLPSSELAYFEPRFRRSFRDVRIYSGADADAAARSINARAFTLGRDIGFARGQYRPGTPAGHRLLAHELAHTLQQGRGEVAPATVQADFWDTLGRGWEMYWGVDDEGAPFARQLMEHYLLGFGTDFDVSSGSDPAWNRFMLDRPEIQRAMRPVLEAMAARVAAAGPTHQPWFRWGAGPTVTETVTGVRLNELESMRLTLHGCHRIQVEVNYDVNAISGGHEVIFRRISMTWVDVADMHPGTVTELDSGEEVNDAELTAAGSSYNIYIEFDPSQSPVNQRTVYHVSGGSVTRVSGWPPAPGAAAPGRRE